MEHHCAKVLRRPLLLPLSLSMIWPGDLVLDPTWPKFKNIQDFIKINTPTKSRKCGLYFVQKAFLWLDLHLCCDRLFDSPWLWLELPPRFHLDKRSDQVLRWWWQWQLSSNDTGNVLSNYTNGSLECRNFSTFK